MSRGVIAVIVAVCAIAILLIYLYNPRDGMYSASQEFLKDSGLQEGHILVGDMGYIYARNSEGVIADGSASFDFSLDHSLGTNRRYTVDIGENPLLPTQAIAEFDFPTGRLTIYDMEEKTILFDGYYNNELNA